MFEFLALFVLFYIWHTLGITVGLHRLLSHRSFACPQAVEYFFVLSGYLAFEGSPMWWATIHRAHHRHDDTDLDPHSPRNGLFNAHFGWLLKRGYKSHVDPAIHAKDLINDPVYRFLEQGGSWHRAHLLTVTICLGFRVILFLLFGWVPALASLLAGVVVFQVPLMLNVLCHIPRLGYKTFATNDDSVNIWWVAVFALGEGWHNNHHASPGSAKTGLRPSEFDPTWLLIALMKKLGLVTRVNVVVPERLILR
jgi:fatty-acid desaturase